MNNDFIWYDKYDYPDEDRKVIVKDKDGKKHDNHTWNGHCYYDWVEYDDGTGDGYRSDVDIVSWRYDTNKDNKVKPMLMQLAEPEYMCPECGVKFYLSLSKDRVVLNPLPTHCNYCNKEFDWTNK